MNAFGCVLLQLKFGKDPLDLLKPVSLIVGGLPLFLHVVLDSEPLKLPPLGDWLDDCAHTVLVSQEGAQVSEGLLHNLRISFKLLD